MIQHELFIVKSSPTKLTSKARSAMLLSNMLLKCARLYLFSSLRTLLLLTIPMHYLPVVVKTTSKFNDTPLKSTFLPSLEILLIVPLFHCCKIWKLI